MDPGEGKNAAAYFERGCEALHVIVPLAASVPLFGQAPLPLCETAVSAPLRGSITAFLRANRDALGLFSQGAELPGSRYAVNLSRGYDTRLPHLHELKRGFGLLELQVLSLADAKESE